MPSLQRGVQRGGVFFLCGREQFPPFLAATASPRFLFPSVLYEPSLKCFAGKPEEDAVGEVSTRMKKERQRFPSLWLVISPWIKARSQIKMANVIIHRFSSR
jgi:hypothetical protein